MTDHHDFGDHDDFPVFDEHHGDAGHDEQPSFEEHQHDLYEPDDHDPGAFEPGHFEPGPFEEHHEPPAVEDPQIGDPQIEDHVVETADPVEVFPPALDVGELPEPVDGFPWIDTGSLGVVHAAAAAETTDPVRPEELAEYAGLDLPEAQDPWAALAGSEDPATSTLARWWQEN